MVTGTAQLASAHSKVCLPLEHAGRVILFSFLPEPDDVRTWAGLFSCASAEEHSGTVGASKNILSALVEREWGSWHEEQGRVGCTGNASLWGLQGLMGASLVAQVAESACIAGDSGSVPGLGRSPGEGNSNPFRYSCLENPMDRGAWRATVHGVQKDLGMTEQLTHTYTQGLMGN